MNKKKSNWVLSKHISDHMVKGRLGDSRPPAFWPSEASAVIQNDHGENEIVGACRRHTFLRYTRDKYIYDNQTNSNYKPLVEEVTELKTEPDRYMRWIWAAGDLFEDFVVEQAKQSGVWTASQIQIVIPTWNIVGKLDLIVESPETGGLIAEEIKSVYGYAAEKDVLGTQSMRRRGQMGAPRNSNLMQLAIYDWHLKPRIPNLEDSRLFYGSRDTGKDAEFSVRTYLDVDDGLTHIEYQGISPLITAPVVSPITIDNILEQFQYVQEHYDKGYLPPRDFDLNYSPEKIHTLYERGELSETDNKTYEKILERKKENEELIAKGEKPKRELKPLEIVDWHCSRCEFVKFCYNEDGIPRRD